MHLCFKGKIQKRVSFLNPDRRIPEFPRFKCHRKTVRRLEVGYECYLSNRKRKMYFVTNVYFTAAHCE